MKRLDNLPQIAQRQLGGLEASAAILAKAKLEAADRRAPRWAMTLRPVAAVCAALVLCVGAVAALNTETVEPETVTPINVLDSHSAGLSAPTAVPRTLAEVPSGVISMSAGIRRSGDTLFAELGSSAFPLITLDGATYRLLVSPSAISASLLGDAIGTVNEFNIEPALGSGGVVSNAVACGETVYAISGMNGALAAAKVDGTLRVFQRVSYAGNSIIGNVGGVLQEKKKYPAPVWITSYGLYLEKLIRTLHLQEQSEQKNGEHCRNICLINTGR